MGCQKRRCCDGARAKLFATGRYMLRFRSGEAAPDKLVRLEDADELVIRGGTLIDGTGRPPLERATIVIQQGRISAVGVAGEVEVPAGARELDAGGSWIMPGLTDCHVHLNGEITRDAYRR